MSETAVIVLCIAGVFLAALVLAYRYGQKQKRDMGDLAAAQGWTISRTETQGIAAKIAEVLPAIRFDVNCVMTVETGVRKLYLVRGAYRFRNRPKSQFFAGFCLLESGTLHSIGVRV